MVFSVIKNFTETHCKNISFLLAYRTLTSTDLPTVRDVWALDSKQLWKPQDKCGVYQSDYFSVQRLVTHSEQMSTDDLFHYSLTAYFLSEIIRLTKFLPELWSDTSDEIQKRMAALLLRHIQQMICNAQTISINEANQCEELINDDQNDMNTRFASAIFPTCALMNHSCVPNIRCIFDQGFLHVQTARRIRKGEEILNCYGPQKSLMPSTEQRRSILSEQYFVRSSSNTLFE